MGMFDYLTCEYPLPDPAFQGNEFQTKSGECQLEKLRITKEGLLMRSQWCGSKPDGSVNVVESHWPFTGSIVFYDQDEGYREYRLKYFEARFEDGKLKEIGDA